MEFEIGQKVVCVYKSNNRSDWEYDLVLDKIYTVKGLFQCCTLSINIGWNRKEGFCWCNNCRTSPQGVVAWLSSTCFIPLQEYTRQEELVKELIEPIKVKV